MLEIEKFDHHSLRHYEDFEFHSRVHTLGQTLLTRDDDKIIVATYGKYVEQLGEALRQNKYSLLTKDVKAAHDSMIRFYVGMSMGVRSLTYAPDADLSREAKLVVMILKKYDTPFKGTYDEKHTKLYRIHRELQELPDATRSMLELDRWLGPLDDALHHFNDVRSQYVNEQSQIEHGKTIKMRIAADKAYQQFITVIQAYAVVYGETYYGSFIQQLNAIISNADAKLKARSTRKRNRQLLQAQQQSETAPAAEQSENYEA